MWDWAIGLPLADLLDAAMKNQRNLFVVRELVKGVTLRHKCKMQEGDIAVEVCSGKVTDIWVVK